MKQFSQSSMCFTKMSPPPQPLFFSESPADSSVNPVRTIGYTTRQEPVSYLGFAFQSMGGFVIFDHIHIHIHVLPLQLNFFTHGCAIYQVNVISNK